MFEETRREGRRTRAFPSRPTCCSARSARGEPAALGGAQIDVKDGRIVVDAERRTSLEGVWAGGDCVFGGQDLTVSAVEDGKQAARSIAAAFGARFSRV